MRLRPLTEAECQARLYGGWEPTVTIVRVEPRRPRDETTLEQWLDERAGDEAEAEAA